MTLLAYNGFEGYTDPYDQRDASDFIVSMNRNNMVYSTGRNGGKSLKYNNDSFNACTCVLHMEPIVNTKIAILGYAFKIGNIPASNVNNFLIFAENQNNQGCVIDLLASGSLKINAKDLNVIETVYFPVNLNQWYYMEVKVKVHATTGVCIVNIDEQNVMNYSGDLYWAGGTTIDEFAFVFGYNVFLEIDDIYLADNQGTENNDFLGDIRIDAVHPNGAGNYAQMIPSAGNNYECVDETEMDDTDYVEGANAAEKDSYAYADVPTDLDDSGIIALQTKNNCQRTGTASNIKIDPFIRTGSTDYSQTAQDLPDTVGMVSGDIVIEDPSDSLIWTQAKINACEFGMEVN